MRPVIGITCSFEQSDQPSPRLRACINAAYTDAIYLAGGLPWPIPTPRTPDPLLLDELLTRCHGLLFTGGPDLDPRHYGQPPHPKTEILHERRDRFDLALFRRADQARRPILAICLGCQIASVGRGGALLQHVDDVPRENAVTHYRPDHASAFHEVRLEQGSRIASIVGQTRLEVNSRHHQLVDPDRVGGQLRPVGFAPDGVIEALETTDDRYLIAVQWHPEDLTDRPEHLRLFQSLVAEAARSMR